MKSWLKKVAAFLFLITGGSLLAFWIIVLQPNRTLRAYLNHCVSLLDERKTKTGLWPTNTAELVRIAGVPPSGIGAQEFYSTRNDYFYFHFRFANRPNGSCVTFRSYDRAWRFFNGDKCDTTSAENPKMTCDPNPFSPNCQVPFL